MGVVDTNDWDGKYDIENMRTTGFLAQDVAKAAKDCGYDFSGVDNTADVYSLNYAQFVVPLVKAVQELSKENENQTSLIENLQSQIDELKNVIESLSNPNNDN